MTAKRQRLIVISVIAIVLTGLLFRLPLLSSVPLARNQDEASAGYEAWAILRFGTDRNGNNYPVLLESWGSGQNALYSYLTIPFVAAFGMNPVAVRIPMIILGVAAIILAFFFGRRQSIKLGVLFAFALSLNPWHVMISRWALESNILPFFVLLAMYFAERAYRKPVMLIPGAAVLALSLYAYGTAFIWAPVFAVFSLIYMAKSDSVFRKRGGISVIIAAAVFAVIAFPIALCHIRNALGLPEMRLFGLFTLPELTSPRQAATMNFHILRNGANLIKLLILQNDGLLWNRVKPFGMIYGVPGLALAAAGIIFSVRDKAFPIPIIALISGAVTMLFVNININRANVLLIPLVWFQAYALYWFWLRLKPLAAAIMLAAVVGFASFWITYTGRYGSELAEFLRNADNMPYIYCLYNERVSPRDFADTVEYFNPGEAFQWVKSFEWRDENGQWQTYNYQQPRPAD
ncbi:MAG: hypothetical protein LBT88_04535 [Oscillospiraceae bacterium]|jgi:4-amino-4-deoxy-L-arabinose transferase-like glycosyltransferase|nr:hypothetical protein [Oscillospiraceae bacterium]